MSSFPGILVIVFLEFLEDLLVRNTGCQWKGTDGTILSHGVRTWGPLDEPESSPFGPTSIDVGGTNNLQGYQPDDWKTAWIPPSVPL